MRVQFFEFEDLKWFPDVIRQGMLDYLRFLFVKLNIYQPTIPLIAEVLKQSAQNKIIDLCSGGGGAIEKVQKELEKDLHKDIPVIVCDKFPNIDAYEHLKKKSNGKIDFILQSVDATNVPESFKGVRTIFSAFHHFNPTSAKKVLQNAVDCNMPIAIFDGGDKNILIMLAIIIMHPIVFFFCTLFFKPYKLSRIILTYLIPLIPFCTIWDGIVSILRLYQPKDLNNLIKNINAKNYVWRTGKVKHRWGFNVVYLTGYPEKATKI